MGGLLPVCKPISRWGCYPVQPTSEGGKRQFTIPRSRGRGTGGECTKLAHVRCSKSQAITRVTSNSKKKHPDRLAELHSKLLTDFAVPLAPQGYLLLCSKDETDHNALVCGRCQWVKVNLQACGRCGHCGEILLEILPSSNCFPKE